MAYCNQICFFQIQSLQLPVTPEMVRPYPKGPARKKAARRRVSGKSQIGPTH